MSTRNAPRLTWEEAVQNLRRDPSQRGLTEACYYDDPILSAALRFHSSDEWSATRSLLGTARGNALDLGAGRGIASFALASDGWTVTAVEPDPSHVVGTGAITALSNAGRMPINVVQAHAEELPFSAGEFSLVYARAVLHHAGNLARVCQEAARVLKPGGILLAVREHVISRSSDLQQFLDNHPLHHSYGGENAFLLTEYVRAIQSGGLTVRHVLNPWASPINMYPSTAEQIGRSLAKRLRLPTFLVPEFVLPALGARINSPGRLYSFLATKGT